jgi:hypothetical protein
LRVLRLWSVQQVTETGKARQAVDGESCGQVAAENTGTVSGGDIEVSDPNRPSPTGPATQIHAPLRGSLAPLGVRLTPAALRELAADIAAGRPVELP